MNQERLKQALASLARPEYSGLRSVFGTVLEIRSCAPEPDCAWFGMLADRLPILEQINLCCLSYTQLVSAADAQKKAEADLLGPAKKSPYSIFQNSLGDFYAELAAVGELSKLGYEQFRAKHASSKGKAYDYDAVFGKERVCIEVKHLRRPRTVVDVFFDEVRRLASSDARNYPFSFDFQYFYDNTVTPDQERLVLSYFETLRGRPAPFTDRLSFPDETVARVVVRPGLCTAMRSAHKSIDDPESFNVEGLLNKVREKAERAYGQMAAMNFYKVLVLNINTPWAELALNHIHRASQIVREASGGNLHAYFMHYYGLIDPDDISVPEHVENLPPIALMQDAGR